MSWKERFRIWSLRLHWIGVAYDNEISTSSIFQKSKSEFLGTMIDLKHTHVYQKSPVWFKKFFFYQFVDELYLNFNAFFNSKLKII